MELINVEWTPTVNKLTVKCCKIFYAPSNYSLVRCPICGKIQYWHETDPHWDDNYTVMDSAIV